MANLYYYLDMRRPHKDGRGPLKIALQHKRNISYKYLDIDLLPNEWDGSKNQITSRPDKKFLNVEIRMTFNKMSAGLERVMRRDDYDTLTASEILDMIARGAETVDEPRDLDFVLPVYNEYITLCRKTSTAKVYKASLNNLIEFCGVDIDTLTFKKMNVAWLRKYQHWLLDKENGQGMEVNGANVYLRNLRTIFNYALKNEFTSARYPFKDIDMSTTEPDRRTVPYEKFLAWATQPMPDGRDFYRDLFMLSFYLCGIRPVDLLHVKKSQVEEGRLVYKPEKLNGRTTLSIKIEPEAWALIKKYEGKEYLINVMESRTDYRAFMAHWNKAVKAIGRDEVKEKIGRNGKHYQTVKHHGIAPYMTIYYARTLWATYAYNELDIPMDTISQALGHKSGLKVTNFYVKRDTKRVDEANRNLIDHVTDGMRKKAGETASA